MSEPGAEISRPGIFSSGRWLVAAAFAGWLAYAGAIFRGGGASPAAARFALLAAVAAGIWRIVADLASRDRGTIAQIAINVGTLAGLALSLRAGGPLTGVAVPAAFAAWLAIATGLISALGHLGMQWLAPESGKSTLDEAVRWVLVLAAGTYILWPYYTAATIGAGDAVWYTLMLSDFAEQIRLGAFPVWLGQTEFAFNGAFSPLRLAPWFQHFGGWLDQLTGRSLEYAALKNLVLVVNAVFLAFSSYFSLRAILRARPVAATVLAIALAFSPALLASIYIGDQYMTFVALPFLPVVFYALWRAYERNDAFAHLLLAAGLAALWWAHTPVALWTTSVAALAYLGKMIAHRGRGEITNLTLAAVAFLVLAGWPLFSAFTLENTAALNMDAGTVLGAVKKAFPANFIRLSKGLVEPADYQLGLALLAVLAWSLVLLIRRPKAAAFALLLGLAVLAVFTLPVPALTEFLWFRIPDLVIQVTNAWPMQRLMPIAACLIVFLCAMLLSPERARRTSWIWLIVFGAPLAIWSQRELARMHERGYGTISDRPAERALLERHNLLVTRYSYSSFASAPASYSHGYMNPLLEHRLLRRDRSLLVANLESAAHKGALPAGEIGDLLAHGTFTAVNDNNTTFYNLSPTLTLPANVPLVLWLEPLDAGQPGWLQITGQRIFREYILPDSGLGVVRREPATSFGTLPSSRPIIPLFTPQAPQETPRLTVIAPQRAIIPSFDFARFELWRYDPKTLPIAVKSWVPYRLTVRSTEAAYLETPRLWMRGYQATINGQVVPVQRSPDNLAMFPIAAGESEVAIDYSPGRFLAAAYWIGLIAWVALIAAGISQLASRPAVFRSESVG